MPFRKFPKPTLPLPTVEVRFKGLLVVNPAEDSKECQIGIHRLGDDHFPLVEMRGLTPLGRDFLVTRLLGPLKGNPLTIGLNPKPKDSYVYAFRPARRPFDRSKDHDDEDLGWAVDLQDPKYFHKEKLQMFKPGVEPFVEMTDCVFFSGHVTDSTLVAVKVDGPAGPSDLHRIADVICAGIQLPDEGHRVLIAGGGLDSPLVLPRLEDDIGTTYTISIRNEPLAINFIPTHDELDQYYEVMRRLDGTAVPSTGRFQVRVSSIPHPGTTDEIPCMPVVNRGG